ncbi:Hypothetical predicted protein [Olea europaea subsp. europaea]|uniref:Uncharacterized protein n=1 Tax=Olea europaea subsp. europaea TaxID=158383 RepID=A0A8S0Q3L3_OLEEU|nr:Hypothetical predicted protein [Olea europaea subsp. europaea]
MSSEEEESYYTVYSLENYLYGNSSEESQSRVSLHNCLIRILVEHILKLSSRHGHVIDMLENLERMGIQDIEFGQELKVFFTVSNQQIMSHISLNLSPNLVVAALINFHLLMVEESGEWDFALSNFLTKFELLKAKIKEHCIAVSKMPSDMTPKTPMVSIFIVDSVLDDLMDLIKNKPDKIIGVEGQIVMLHKELISLRSSVTNMAGQHEAKHEELMIQTSDIPYEVEYVINSFLHIWYLTLRLLQLIEKI